MTMTDPAIQESKPRTVSALVREVITESGDRTDHTAMVDEVLLRMTDEEKNRFLAQAIRRVVITEASSFNAQVRNAPRGTEPKTFVQSWRIKSVKDWIEEFMATTINTGSATIRMGDATANDLRGYAELGFERIAEESRTYEKANLLADALNERGVTQVQQLPADVVEAIYRSN